MMDKIAAGFGKMALTVSNWIKGAKLIGSRADSRIAISRLADGRTYVIGCAAASVSSLLVGSEVAVPLAGVTPYLRK